MRYCDITIKDSVEYNSKLNEHSEYIKMLKILESKCAFIGITSGHEIINYFKNDIFKIEETSSWWNKIVSYIDEIYYIKATGNLFLFLRKYETFSKYIVGNIEQKIGDKVILTSFGQDDIAFFDKNNNLLLCTNTHEGFIDVADTIDKEFNKN